ncbi:MAG TPA: PadR family transcriptional regulator [Ktedonobacteraceae bacterium]|nr:PadR family transcriptional regulator [Ktedonobacteraceae bacterium]
MYELVVLSQLMRWPMHGYLIMKITNDVIGPWARISSGTLSTILKRLEQTGLIAVLPQERDPARSAPRARTFAITEEGRKRFHQLMMDTSSNLGDYQKIFHYKMGFLDLLRSDERLLLMNHYINYCQTTILHVQSEMESLVYELADHPSPAFLENVVRTMKHIVQQWQAEYDWMNGVREQALAQMKKPHSPTLQEEGD